MFLRLVLIASILEVLYADAKVGLFWGQNEAYNKYGQSAQEPRLKYFCSKGIYDVIILRGLIDNVWSDRIAPMPRLNFANHCPTTGLRTWYSKYGYLICPEIGSDIRYCQAKGVKILLDIGGIQKYKVVFRTKGEASEFAKQLWNAFLGNTFYEYRTFGSVELDGINLSLREGSPHTSDFIKDIATRIKKSNVIGKNRRYMLTASPLCHYLAKKEFTLDSSLFDRIFIDYTVPGKCLLTYKKSIVRNVWFKYQKDHPSLEIWFIFSSSPDAAGTYETYFYRREIKDLLKRELGGYFTGFVLNDASYDVRNTVNGLSLSQYIHAVAQNNRKKSKPLVVALCKKCRISISSGSTGDSSNISYLYLYTFTLICIIYILGSNW